ncbi:MAG TPA: glycosyltransferase [Terriglobales bacterium]|nr:glycosyltransferase [Terriglobales bacterium]
MRNPSPIQNDAEAHAQALSQARVAIVHHWFVRQGGGERFVEHLANLLPQADLYALVACRQGTPPALRPRKVATSFLQRFPGSRRWHRLYMPLFPLALEQFDLSAYDLVISSESGPAKGVITPARTCHICYCHTPMRYIWEMYPQYLRTAPFGPLGRAIFAASAHYLRQWDLSTAARVDFFAANSANTARRIAKVYRRTAEIIHCPIDTKPFAAPRQPEDFYLVVSRLVSYKRIDLAVSACKDLHRHLVVIGDGEDARALAQGAGPTTKFLGRCTDETIRDHYRRARALLFPGEEDHGLAPIEAQAAGCPVIAFGRGGALETVRGRWVGQDGPEKPTGVFFSAQTRESLAEAILFFERNQAEFSPNAARANAEQFDVSHFRRKMAHFIERCMAQKSESAAQDAPSTPPNPNPAPPPNSRSGPSTPHLPPHTH